MESDPKIEPLSTARRKELRDFFHTGLPVVYLHDALGIAESLCRLRIKMIIIRNKLVSRLNGKSRRQNRNRVITDTRPDFVDTMAMLAD